MIPNFVNINSPYNVLPEGIHCATKEELYNRYATTEYRKQLLDGFYLGATALWNAGCKAIYIDGSFITNKDTPGDFDACWDPTGVNASFLQFSRPELLEFRNNRALQKKVFKGEFFPSLGVAMQNPVTRYLDFFQNDRYTGNRKGIIRVIN